MVNSGEFEWSILESLRGSDGQVRHDEIHPRAEKANARLSKRWGLELSIFDTVLLGAGSTACKRLNCAVAVVEIMWPPYHRGILEAFLEAGTASLVCP